VTVMAIATFVIGVLVLRIFEDWTVLSCVYVIVQIMTTIGYGDVTVSSASMRIFMSVYAIWCLILLASVMNEAIELFITERSKQLREQVIARLAGATDEASKRTWVQGAGAKVVSSGAIFLVFLLAGTVFFSVVDRTPNGCDAWEYGECIHTEGEAGLTLDEAWYMSVITLTTVGFGDYSPKAHHGRVFSIVWMVLGVGSAARFLTRVQEFIFQIQAPDLSSTIVALDAGAFREIDSIDGHEDGYITRGEFLSWVLKKYELADPAIVDQLNSIFERLLKEEESLEEDSCIRTREVTQKALASLQRRMSASSGAGP